MEMTLAAAAHLIGKGKSTLLRAVKSGKLSARRTEDGTFMVDASELARVFAIKPVERVSEAALMHHDTPRSGGGADDAELADLRVKVAVQAAQLEEKATQLEREKETVDDLRKRLDRAEERVHALTYQAQAQPAKPVGFLGRLLGR